MRTCACGHACSEGRCRNYAPTILPQVEGAKKGYSQILWLFGPDHNLTEVLTLSFVKPIRVSVWMYVMFVRRPWTCSCVSCMWLCCILGCLV
jgi:hypothetical protein